MIHKDCEKS